MGAGGRYDSWSRRFGIGCMSLYKAVSTVKTRPGRMLESWSISTSRSKVFYIRPASHILGGRGYLTLLICSITTSSRNTGHKQLEEPSILTHATIVCERTPSARDRVNGAFALNSIDHC